MTDLMESLKWAADRSDDDAVMIEVDRNGAKAVLSGIEQLERELADFKASQHYRYIGVDGKPVLARELEDRAIKAERELAVMKGCQECNLQSLSDTEAELAAEKALADQGREVVQHWVDHSNHPCQLSDEFLAAYRKARGL